MMTRSTEHVINPNTKTDEGAHGVQGRVGEAEHRADAQPYHKPHHDTQDANHGEEEPHLDTVPLAEHQDGIGEHEDVAGSHQPGI